MDDFEFDILRDEIEKEMKTIIEPEIRKYVEETITTLTKGKERRDFIQDYLNSDFKCTESGKMLYARAIGKLIILELMKKGI